MCRREAAVDVSARSRCLFPSAGVQGLIAGALDALFDVPVGFAAPD